MKTVRGIFVCAILLGAISGLGPKIVAAQCENVEGLDYLQCAQDQIDANNGTGQSDDQSNYGSSNSDLTIVEPTNDNGWKDYDAGNYQEALKAFGYVEQEWFVSNTDLGEAKFGEALTRFQLGQYASTLILLQDAEDNAYNPVEVYGWRCYVNIVLTKYDAAMQACNTAITLDRSMTNPDAIVDRGYVKIMQGDYEGAVTDLTSVISSKSRDSFSHDTLALATLRYGIAKLELGDYSSAEVALSTSLKLATNTPGGDATAQHFWLMFAYGLEHKQDEATKEAQAVADAIKGFDQARQMRWGALFETIDSADKAEQTYQLAFALDPHPHNWVNQLLYLTAMDQLVTKLGGSATSDPVHSVLPWFKQQMFSDAALKTPK